MNISMSLFLSIVEYLAKEDDYVSNSLLSKLKGELGQDSVRIND